MKIFCNHKWKPIAKSMINEDHSRFLIDMFTNYQDIMVVLFQCQKCGKIKKVKMK